MPTVIFTDKGGEKELTSDQLDAVLWAVHELKHAADLWLKDAIEEARDDKLSWREVARALGFADGMEACRKKLHELQLYCLDVKYDSEQSHQRPMSHDHR